MKKQYEPPRIDVLVLEQDDIITASPIKGGYGTMKGEHGNVEHQFTWDE